MSVVINVYLHGFFFIETSKDKLVIASPKYDMHNFGYWDDQERAWHTFPNSPFSWIKALQDGGKQDFPKDILQFSRDDLGLKRSFIQPPDAIRQYAVYLELPLPADITSARDGGDLSEFHMKDGKVKKSVSGHCGDNTPLCLLSRLTYVASGPVGFNAINFYAEHCMAPGSDDLNLLFDKTREVLPDFDLKLVGLGQGRTLEKPDSDNEETLCELGSSLKENPCDATKCRQMHHELLRTANCPQFGIVQS